jgi:hypothetical protein
MPTWNMWRIWFIATDVAKHSGYSPPLMWQIWCCSRAKPLQFGVLPLHSVWNLTSCIHFNQQDSDDSKLYRSRRSKWQVLSNCKCCVTLTSSRGYKTVYEERQEQQRMQRSTHGSPEAASDHGCQRRSCFCNEEISASSFCVRVSDPVA